MVVNLGRCDFSYTQKSEDLVGSNLFEQLGKDNLILTLKW